MREAYKRVCEPMKKKLDRIIVIQGYFIYRLYKRGQNNLPLAIRLQQLASKLISANISSLFDFFAFLPPDEYLHFFSSFINSGLIFIFKSLFFQFTFFKLQTSKHRSSANFRAKKLWEVLICRKFHQVCASAFNFMPGGVAPLPQLIRTHGIQLKILFC